jgi:hypothetical protein
MKAMNVPGVSKFCARAIALFMFYAAFVRPVSAQWVPQSYFLPTPLEQAVRITSPANHSTFYAPVDLPIFAYAHLTDEAYTNLDFYYSGTNNLGQKFTNYLGAGFSLSLTNDLPRIGPVETMMLREEPRLRAVYCFVWTNVPAGSYALTAVARGLQLGYAAMARTSPPVNITILAGVTNNNPADVVSIVATDPVAIAGTNVCWIWSGITNTTPAWTNWPPVKPGYTTNWGPKNAVFTIRRFGNAITNLSVSYNVSGTATNGGNYVQLTGNVTIPAGEAYTLIPVVPIYDNRTNFIGTVVLTLTSTNIPPAYAVGLAARAAAVVLDYWPRPLPWLLADHSFHVSTNGPDGAWYSIENSPDLQNWTSVATNQVINGSIDYVDPSAPNYSSGFYRVLTLTNAPQN